MIGVPPSRSAGSQSNVAMPSRSVRDLATTLVARLTLDNFDGRFARRGRIITPATGRLLESIARTRNVRAPPKVRAIVPGKSEGSTSIGYDR